ncbi:hypothetical protein [Pseudomonas japonica]|uniref:hypothetical protein n=1 Tax=Pseudomonas japonica TaxID=256466 RepID=UPI003A83F252
MDLTDPGLAPVRKRLELLQERIHKEIRDMTAPEAPYSEMVRTWLKQFLDGL